VARHGKERRYRLRGTGLRRLHTWLKKYEVFWDTKLATLGQVLDRGKRGEEEP